MNFYKGGAMKYTTAIFDLDGTLLDTLGDLADASNQVLCEFGYPEHPADAYKYFVGDGLRTLMVRITPDYVTDGEIEKCCRLFMKKYEQCWDKTSKPYPGIIEMVAELQRLDIKCAVLSNKPHEFTEIFVKRFFPARTFDAVFGQRPGIPKKPDPAGALEIMNQFSVTPEQCIYIGDTSTDMQTGKNGGMFTVGVLWGFREREELMQNKADVIVQTPMEIVKHVVSAG